jgi:membrane associated rhomboid family serine protease
LWALCPIALAFTGSLIAAIIVFGLGGLVWAPFTPVAYSFLQSGLASHEQQQVVTLWTTGSMVAAPLGLAEHGMRLQVPPLVGLVVDPLVPTKEPQESTTVTQHRSSTTGVSGSWIGPARPT